MNKLMVTVVGVVLATAAVSASAGKQDRESLAQCKADIERYYGADTRVKLRSIKRTSGGSDLRLTVKSPGAGNELIVCSVDRDGTSSLATRAGVALTPTASVQEKVSLVE